MWTHLQPYLDENGTSSSIQRQARVGLWRAINLGSLIVFAGSGVTRGNGQPSWRGILVDFIDQTLQEFQFQYPTFLEKNQTEAPKDTIISQTEIADQILLLCGLARSDLKKRTEQPLISEHMVSSSIRDETLFSALDLCEELLASLTHHSETRDALALVRTRFAKRFAVQMADTDPAAKTQTLSIQDPDRNLIGSIFRNTGTKRILTTNYDVEFEAWLYQNRVSAAASPSEKSDFTSLVSHTQSGPTEQQRTDFNKFLETLGDDDEKKAELKLAFEGQNTSSGPRRIEISTALNKAIVSSSLNSSNIGDLLNFASYSRSYEAQVFHLHGRFDHPDDMVVTRRDYRRVYAQEASAEQAFQAAQEVLFAGNDVLMLGFGATEEDLMRPFRRFVSRGPESGQAPRQTFALMPSATATDTGGDEATKLLRKRRNDEQIVRLALNFGVYVLHYGGDHFCEVVSILKGFSDLLDKDDMTIEVLQKSLSAIEHQDILHKELELEKAGYNALTNAEILNELRGQITEERIKSKDFSVLREHVDALISIAQSAALSNELQDLKRQSRDWWDTWRQAPHERRAIYHTASKEISGEDNYLRVRHCSDKLLHRSYDFIDGTGAKIKKERAIMHDSDDKTWPLIEATRSIAEQLDWDKKGQSGPLSQEEDNVAEESAPSDVPVVERRRILRIATSRGGGKSTLVDLLHHKDNQGYIFLRNDWCKETDSYVDAAGEPRQGAAFIAHLSFSMEFTSVIKSFTRFLALEIAKAADSPVETSDEANELVANFQVWQAHWRDKLDGFTTIDDGLVDATAKFEARDFPNFRELVLRAHPLKSGDDAIDADVLEKLRDATNIEALRKLNLSDDERKRVHCILAGATWEEDQSRIGAIPADHEVTLSAGAREHRMDTLRRLMVLYQKIASNRPLFVCLSGLDRITSPSGDAYNPAHRLFFRLLTGCDETKEEPKGEKLPHQSPRFRPESDQPFSKLLDETLDPPLDIILISGRPDTPICYLSVDHSHIKRDIPAPLVQHYSRKSATKRWLRKWNELDRMDWLWRIRMLGIEITQEDKNKAEEIETNYLASPLSEDRRDTPLEEGVAAAVFLQWAETTNTAVSQRHLSSLHGSQRLHRLLTEYLCLSLWVMNAWVQQSSGAIRHAFPIGFHSFLRDLDGVAAKNGIHGVIAYILAGYRRADEVQNQAANQADNRPRSTSAQPPECAEEDTSKSPDDASSVCPLLNDLILKHLVLFALPVEPWVLLGCPRIRNHLTAKYDALFGQTKEKGWKDALAQTKKEDVEDGVKNLNRTFLAVCGWHRRAWMLNELGRALHTLAKRQLVMKVFASFDHSEETSAKSEFEPEQGFLHLRFSLHNLLRQHLAHKMDMAIDEGADLNHHRMSIYCDQPRDLPSPSKEHFAFIEEIITFQVEKIRETLSAAYQHSRESYYTRMFIRRWDPSVQDDDAKKERSSRAAARRIYAPDIDKQLFKTLLEGKEGTDDVVGLNSAFDGWDAPESIAGGLGRVHAVPQRLRALFSLIQGSFSIGSLSRLSTPQGGLDGEAPFDAYRTWLRSLLNAGASLERTRQEIEGLLSGRLGYPDGGDDAQITRWIQDCDTVLKSLKEKTDDSSIEDAADVLDRMVEQETNIRKASKSIGFNKRQVSQYNKLRHPFYRDEIAWLYNERGLTSLTQGMVLDAIPLLEKASFIMSHQRTPNRDTHAYHAAERRIELNLAIAKIARGRISEARGMLNSLAEGSAQIKLSTPSEIKLFSDLYLSLCDHLSGAIIKAEDRYNDCLKAFVARKKLRAVAISSRFLADLMRMRGDSVGARSQAEIATKAAARAEQRDIEHICLITEARIDTMCDDLREARSKIDRVLSYSEDMGLVATQVDAKIAMSQLMLKRGDFGLSGQHASEATSLAVKHGLRLRKLSALVSFAETRSARGSHQFAHRLLQNCVVEAEQIGYLTLAARANDIIAKLNFRRDV